MRLTIRGFVVMATLAGFWGSPPTFASSVEEAERLVFGRACDSGPEYPMSFVAPDGSGLLTREEYGNFIGARVSPAEVSTSLRGELVVAQGPGSSHVLVNLQTGTSSTLDDRFPPTPQGSVANIAWGCEEFGVEVAYAGQGEVGQPSIIVHGESGPEVIASLGTSDTISGLDWFRPLGRDGIIWAVGDPALPTPAGDPTAPPAVIVRFDDGGWSKIGDGLHPRWSPDGSLIAFVIGGELAVMENDGGNVQLLGRSGGSPVWSPDGKRIAFIGRKSLGEPQYIGILDLATGITTTVIDGTIECDDVFALWDWSVTVVPKQTFTDVPHGSLFWTDVEWMAAQDITQGCNPPTNDRFCPDDPVTRGELAAFMRRTLGLPHVVTDYFDDDDGSIFEGDINAIAAAGITRGCNPPANDRFCPDDPVTRGQIAAFWKRALQLPASPADWFVDDNASIFEDDINAMAAAGITRGCNPPANDRFCPDDPVTRGQYAAFTHRASGN